MGGGGGGGCKAKLIRWGGGGGRVGGGGGGAKFSLFAGCKLIGVPAPNQCQIITFLTLKTGNIANLRMELNNILNGTYIKLVHL